MISTLEALALDLFLEGPSAGTSSPLPSSSSGSQPGSGFSFESTSCLFNLETMGNLPGLQVCLSDKEFALSRARVCENFSSGVTGGGVTRSGDEKLESVSSSVSPGKMPSSVIGEGGGKRGIRLLKDKSGLTDISQTSPATMSNGSASSTSLMHSMLMLLLWMDGGTGGKKSGQWNLNLTTVKCYRSDY